MPKPGPSRDVEDEEVLRAISDAYPPVLGTSDVAERIGVRRQTADKYLRRLWEEGDVESRLIGQVRVWWLTDQGKKRLDPGSNDET